MSGFLEKFRPDPELDGLRRLWRTDKPLLKNAVVAFAPPYPEYPTLKVSKLQGPDSGPGCPSARNADSEVDVALYAANQEGFGGFHEHAWKFLQTNTAAVEAALRRKLFAWHVKQLDQFREEYLPNDKSVQKYWKVIEGQVLMEDVSAIDVLFKLVGVGLADHGLDECGFSSFEFQTGWDRDHGLGVLMHRDRVLAAGGMGELIYGPDISSGVRAVQAYDLDDGDFSLLNL